MVSSSVREMCREIVFQRDSDLLVTAASRYSLGQNRGLA